MSVGIWVLGDQLWCEQAALASAKEAPVIFIESLGYARSRPYHGQKLVLVWSAMRHFAEELRQQGREVTYCAEAEDFAQPLLAWIAERQITQLRVMQPRDRPFEDLIQQLELPCSLKFIPDNHFLWTTAAFEAWAKGRKRLVLEDFYRSGRKRFGVLMEGKHPVGGKWNLDAQNRQPPTSQLNPPQTLSFEPDRITQAVMEIVRGQNLSPYGAISPFYWGVTRPQALAVLDRFIEVGLPVFGAYQDAMLVGEETLWHSLLSPYLNLGLLHPQEIIQKAEQAYHRRQLPLNSVEGFIRQILGWREYMYAMYRYQGPDYSTKNWFEHRQPLPSFYWDARQTDMNCLHQVLSQVERTGYAHHIQRLMILSNFALIAGIAPQAIESWFHAAFIDAYDWVMQTNVIGMGQFADGGILASKPYAASANYVNKMSDYCHNCRYNKSDRMGASACPFNFFYWDFLSRHQNRLQSQGRMNLVLGHLKRISPEDLTRIGQKAKMWHQAQHAGE